MAMLEIFTVVVIELILVLGFSILLGVEKLKDAMIEFKRGLRKG